MRFRMGGALDESKTSANGLKKTVKRRANSEDQTRMVGDETNNLPRIRSDRFKVTYSNYDAKFNTICFQ